MYLNLENGLNVRIQLYGVNFIIKKMNINNTTLAYLCNVRDYNVDDNNYYCYYKNKFIGEIIKEEIKEESDKFILSFHYKPNIEKS